MTTAIGTALNVSGLRKSFPVRGRGVLIAVDNVEVQIGPGETVGLVGESGSGKSTVARCITRLIEPDAGEIQLGSTDLSSLPRRALAGAYTDLQMVFQDPRASLNPRMTVRATLEEPLRLHGDASPADRAERIRQLIDDVRLAPELAERYPSQLSGGQRQRVSIARALAVDPKVVIFDEPTASLDVTTRGQILELLARLQAEHNLAYLFISHDLEVVRHIADRVMVMYLGSVVEQGLTAEIFGGPQHPYTRALLSAVPKAEYGRARRRLRLAGEIPSPIDLPPGCRLASRCPVAEPSCTQGRPPLLSLTATHTVACPVTVNHELAARGDTDMRERSHPNP